MLIQRLHLFLLFGLSLATAHAQEEPLPPPASDTVQMPDSAAPVGVGTVALTADGVTGPAASGDVSVTDTLDWRQRHSPRKATLLSAVLPGAGQMYNRKYWKAPIVWAGLGTCVWFIQDNNREYQRYRTAYKALIDDDPTTVDEFEGQFSSDQVFDVMDTYRRWRDLSYVALGLVYMLNVVDASVDAHFVRFDVSPDLSLNMGPSLGTMAQGAPGLTLTLALR